jgi:hypothetical protein
MSALERLDSAPPRQLKPAAMTSAFPAILNPPPDSSSDPDPDTQRAGLAEDSFPHSHKRKHRHRLRNTYATNIQPPTPPQLTSASTADDNSSAYQSPSQQHHSDFPIALEQAGTGIDVQRWMSNSDSEEHEMDSYHGMSDDDEALAGLTAADRRRIRRGIRHRAGDESEEALIPGDDSDDIITREEKKEADGRVIRDLVINLLLIGLWYGHLAESLK